jgi:hypothetical protein
MKAQLFATTDNAGRELDPERQRRALLDAITLRLSEVSGALHRLKREHHVLQDLRCQLASGVMSPTVASAIIADKEVKVPYPIRAVPALAE